MLRRTQRSSIRYVCLSWTADGNSVGKAMPLLGFKTYDMKSMLAQTEKGKIHPQLWDNYLRPQGEHFEGNIDTNNNEHATSSSSASSKVIVQSRLIAKNKMAQRLGVTTQEKLKIQNISEYDAIVGLPVSTIEPEKLIEFFPGYTKFILVEESNKPEWVRQHIEDGVVPVLVNLQAMGSTSPTGKVWFSLFRHFAWPGSSDRVVSTLPENRDKEMIQPSFMQQVSKATGANKDEDISSRVGDMNAVKDRKEWAEQALTEYEKRVKEAIPADRLYVYRDGDGWEPLLHFTGKEFELLEKLPKYPPQSYGKDFLDKVRLRIARTVMITKLVNVSAVVVLIGVAWTLNEYFLKGVNSIMNDAKKVMGVEEQE